MALTKESIENQTKKVTQLWILVILLTALVAIGGPALLGFMITPSDAYCKQQETIMECGKINIYDEGTGVIGFSVEFYTPYHQGIVNKTPVVAGERIVKVGPDVFWYGRYNITEKTDIPKTVLTFEKPNNTDYREFCRKPKVHDVSCPSLEVTLMKHSLNWKGIADNQNKDKLKPSKGLKELKCRNVKVYKPIDYLGSVDFSVAFDLPFGMATTNITKFPMFKDDQLVFAGKEVHWYGSATQYGGEGLTNSTLAFTQENRKKWNDAHFFELSCPELERKVKEIFDGHWQAVKYLAFLGAFFAFLVAGGFACSLGLCCGDSMARSAVRSML